MNRIEKTFIFNGDVLKEQIPGDSTRDYPSNMDMAIYYFESRLKSLEELGHRLIQSKLMGISYPDAEVRILSNSNSQNVYRQVVRDLNYLRRQGVEDIDFFWDMEISKMIDNINLLRDYPKLSNLQLAINYFRYNIKCIEAEQEKRRLGKSDALPEAKWDLDQLKSGYLGYLVRLEKLQELGIEDVGFVQNDNYGVKYYEFGQKLKEIESGLGLSKAGQLSVALPSENMSLVATDESVSNKPLDSMRPDEDELNVVGQQVRVADELLFGPNTDADDEISEDASPKSQATILPAPIGVGNLDWLEYIASMTGALRQPQSTGSLITTDNSDGKIVHHLHFSKQAGECRVSYHETDNKITATNDLTPDQARSIVAIGQERWKGIRLMSDNVSDNDKLQLYIAAQTHSLRKALYDLKQGKLDPTAPVIQAYINGKKSPEPVTFEDPSSANGIYSLPATIKVGTDPTGLVLTRTADEVLQDISNQKAAILEDIRLLVEAHHKAATPQVPTAATKGNHASLKGAPAANTSRHRPTSPTNSPRVFEAPVAS